MVPRALIKMLGKAVDSKWMSQVLNKCHVEGPVYSRCGEVLNKQGAAGLGQSSAQCGGVVMIGGATLATLCRQLHCNVGVSR